jgi:thioredoxin 1
MAKPLHVRETDWQAMEKSDRPVLVDFRAGWCSPCRMVAPTFEKLAEMYGDEILFAKVNVDELPALAEKFSVRSIPTPLPFREGKVVDRIVGARPYQELARVLDRQVPAPAGS